MSLLLIDACPRARDVSRTYRLAEAFIEQYTALHPQTSIEILRVADLEIRPFDGAAVDRREQLIDAGQTEDSMFALAHQFASAEHIVMAAPYWDFSIPSMLKVYIEHIFVRTVAFVYEGAQPVGLCKAQRMALLTTAGGEIGPRNGGGDYLRTIAGVLGIKHFEQVSAELLDVDGFDAAQIVARAQQRTRELARSF